MTDYPLPSPYDDNTPQDYVDALRDHADPRIDGPLLDHAALGAAQVIERQPREFEAWLKRQRDQYSSAVQYGHPPAWHVIDELLDRFRDHMLTGTPLDREVAGPHPEED